MTETAMETPGQPTGARNSGAAIGAEPRGGSSLAELVYHNAGSIVGCHLVAQPSLHLGIALEHGGAVGSAREYALQMGCDAFEGKAVGKQLGLSAVHAKLLPSQKVERVEELLGEGNKVAFVGDGINDAPVLTRADVGIAMGAMGSDAAIESADIVLMDDKISKLPTAIKIARKTMRIVNENIWIALAVKVIILVLSAFGIADMWIAVFGDVGVLILAVLNAMRAMLKIKDK